MANDTELHVRSANMAVQRLRENVDMIKKDCLAIQIPKELHVIGREIQKKILLFIGHIYKFCDNG